MSAFTTCTRSGAMISILNPDPALIRLADIAHALSLINRYAGATLLPMSVAQHSCLVSKALEGFGPRLALLGLMHDAHEYLTGDITSPMKRAIAHIAGKHVVPAIQANIDSRIWTAFNIAPPTAIEAETIARADEGALASEWRKFMPGEPPVSTPPLRLAWAAMSPSRAEEAFITQFERLHCLLPGVKRP